MLNLYKLHNTIKHYDWGSSRILPQFLGIENSKNLPFAEMWLGTHSAGCSRAELVLRGEEAANNVSLAEAAGGELPFLFKLLALEKPLSIQAHPNKVQAEKGFKTENKAGIALDSPNRNYKDDNYKSEILCALSPFTLMAGFREPEKISGSLKVLISAAPLLSETFSRLLQYLEKDEFEGSAALENFLRSLFELSERERENICSFLTSDSTCSAADGDFITEKQWALMKKLSLLYPKDAAVLSPIYLNLFSLRPGQAVFIPSGTLHSYISGFGAELMSNSDNVLRGGLTNKHIDFRELINILDFSPFMPKIMEAPPAASLFRYPAPCEDFSLFALSGNGEKDFPLKEPCVCVITEGELVLENTTFKKGESFFIPPDESRHSFSGDFSLLAASGLVSQPK